MPSLQKPSSILCLISLILSFIFTCLIIFRAQTQAQESQKNDTEESLDDFYEDEDGVAAKEPHDGSRGIWLATIFAVSSAVCGLLLSISLSLYRYYAYPGPMIDFVNDWIFLSTWILVLLLTILVLNQRSMLSKFRNGRNCSIASFSLFIALLVDLYGNLQSYEAGDIVFTPIAVGVQAALAFVHCLSCVSLPRTPTVKFNDQIVDRQHSVSALLHYTFGWSTDALRLSRRKANLDISDFPMLRYRRRSAFLLRWFQADADSRPLWKCILYKHSPELIFQSFFAMVAATLEFTPQVALYALLSLLERQSDASSRIVATWFLVLALGASIVMAAWGDCWIEWLTYESLALPARSELSALIFSKATRRKDVKEAKSQKADTTTDSNDVLAAIEQSGLVNQDQNGNAIDKALGPEAADGDIEKTRQGTINLVSVDAKRISDFLRFHHIFVQVSTKLVISLVFLVKLLGWIPVLAGFFALVIALPINIWTSKRFTDAQDDLMKIRDRKLMVVTEALQGIRQIKFSAQEPEWQERIGDVRTTELKQQWRVFCFDTVLIFCWILGPVLLSAVALAVYATLNGYLSASIAFTSITVFSALEFTLAVVPEFTADGLEAWVSLKRIDEYLRAPERENYVTKGKEIAFDNATVAWPSDDADIDASQRFSLQKINLDVPAKQLTVISGPTGSGKSLLLAAIIGEADLLEGSIRAPAPVPVHERYDDIANRSDWIIDSAVAFVAQIPWIENATIKDNIIFGLPYDKGRYQKVLQACSLTKDLEILEDGDQTDIGFNGINLSGGQRWRVTFARALYSRAGVLVLDDIFSAVDAHVGRQLFEAALTGELGQGRTRVLVTHHVGLVLPKTKYLISLGDGTIKFAGSPETLEKMGGLERIVANESNAAERLNEQGLANVAAVTVDDDYGLRKVLSATSHKSNRIDSGGLDEIFQNKPKKFVEDESKERGSIKLKLYAEYFSNSGGLLHWSSIIVIFCGYEALLLGRSWFVTLWTRAYNSESARFYAPSRIITSTQTSIQSVNARHTLAYYLWIYLALSVSICIIGTLRYFAIYVRSLRASSVMFHKMIYTILRTPLRWLDTVPVGRVLNRVTADFEAIDSRLAGDTGFLVYCAIQIVGIIIAANFVSPFMLLIALVLLAACARVTSWYLDGAREVKRLESIAKSPIFELFGATLTGVATIRSFDKVDIYVDRMTQRIDNHARAYWHLWLFNRWVAFNLNLVGAVFATAVAAFVAFADVDASLAGFALSFALQYSSAVVWATRFYSNVELSMNSVERVSEYSKLPIEDQGSRIEAPAAWPTEGRLEVNDLVVGYAPDLPAVLKGLSFTVESNQRVGVVGRTGAGKSSLTLTLFRFLEAREGTITIDRVNVADIALHTLRSRLAIIPQDPVLFSGTVRSNLDPFDEHTANELRDALQRVHLIRHTAAPSRGEPSDNTGSTQASTPKSNPSITLSTKVSESGLNLSQGQRQLLCLARAIVRRPKLLVLDEATSAVDMETDLLIQRSIREEFQDSTLLVIAHRLSTIADFDRILVMAEGKAVEFDTPKKLLSIEDGVFKGLVEESGEKEELVRVINGQ